MTVPIRGFLSQAIQSERNARLYSFGSEKVRDRVLAEGLGTAIGHTYLGDFVKNGGYADKTMAEIEALLLSNSALTSCELFRVEEGSAEAAALATRHRGLVLRAWGAFKGRIHGPLKKDDSIYGLIRAVEETDGGNSVRPSQCKA